LRVAERLVDNRQMLLEAGRANIRDVREAQDSLIRAQNDLTLATVAYLGTRFDLLLDAGLLLADQDRFWLTDPLAGKVTEADRGRPPLEMPDDKLIAPDEFLEPKS
jgi:hypothetical protein